VTQEERRQQLEKLSATEEGMIELSRIFIKTTAPPSRQDPAIIVIPPPQMIADILRCEFSDNQ
jgi:hypothetical protein